MISVNDWYTFPDPMRTGELCAVGGCGSGAVGWLTMPVAAGMFSGTVDIPLCMDHAIEFRSQGHRPDPDICAPERCCHGLYL